MCIEPFQMCTVTVIIVFPLLPANWSKLHAETYGYDLLHESKIPAAFTHCKQAELLRYVVALGKRIH